MSSQRISDLLLSIDESERIEFLPCQSEQDYLALDISSISSYSSLICDIEWGYNRDGEDLAQVNLCMLLGEKSGLSVFQTVLIGSIRDVSTLKTT